jgi:hypothetical protein
VAAAVTAPAAAFIETPHEAKMRRARVDGEYVVKLRGREVVHAIAALQAYANTLSASGNEDGQYNDVPIVEAIIKSLQAAIDEQTPHSDQR